MPLGDDPHTGIFYGNNLTRHLSAMQFFDLLEWLVEHTGATGLARLLGAH